MAEKQTIIAEIYQSYLQQDVLDLGIKKTEAYQDLIKLIAHQGGNLTNYHKLAASTGLSQPTVKQYLWYAQQTFILHKLRPYFKNPKKEIVKSPVYYFQDLGLLNFVLGQFGQIQLSDNIGLVFENLIYRLIQDELAQSPVAEIKFWRTQHQAEVDFILDNRQQILPIEAKKTAKISRSLHSFINDYQPDSALVVNLDQQQKSTVNSTQVEMIPFFQLRSKLSKLCGLKVGSIIPNSLNENTNS